ncbi:A-kinase anchor protein 9-like isoform X1 [Schistocerca gregaria]|uniref:A-kinase anchor protein 9-like isoform X1 n=1 Tax=Schistocerca gregaria TaxID=7010 RepID=UPI00211E9244|nr:A-kinase anchor protein 9-like isoform X1 [Schistocerca gregaria]
MDDEERQRKVDIGREKFAAFLKKKQASNAKNKTKNLENVGEKAEKEKKETSGELSEQSIAESFPMDELERSEKSGACNQNTPTDTKYGTPDNVNDSHVLNRLQTRIRELEEIVEGKDAALEAARLQLDSQNESQPTEDMCKTCSEYGENHIQVEEYHKKMLEFKAALEQRDNIVQKLSDSLKDALRSRDELQLKGEHLALEVASLNHQLQSTKELIQNQQWNTGIKPDDYILLKNEKCELEIAVQMKDAIIKELNKNIVEKDDALKVKEVELQRKCMELTEEKRRAAEEIRSLMHSIEEEHKAKTSALHSLQSQKESHEAALSKLRINMEENFGLQLVQIKEELRMQFEKEKQTLLQSSAESKNLNSGVEHTDETEFEKLARENYVTRKEVNDDDLQFTANKEKTESLSSSEHSLPASLVLDNRSDEQLNKLIVGVNRGDPSPGDVPVVSFTPCRIEQEHGDESVIDVCETHISSTEAIMNENNILSDIQACQMELRNHKEFLLKINDWCTNVLSSGTKSVVPQHDLLLEQTSQRAYLPSVVYNTESTTISGSTSKGSCAECQDNPVHHTEENTVVELETDLHWVTNVKGTAIGEEINSTVQIEMHKHTAVNNELSENSTKNDQCPQDSPSWTVDQLKCVNHVKKEMSSLKNDLQGLNVINSQLESNIYRAVKFTHFSNMEEFAVKHLTDQGLLAAREEMESQLKHYIKELEKELSEVRVKLSKTQSENMNLQLMVACVNKINKKIKEEGFKEVLLKEAKQIFQLLDEMFSNNAHLCVDYIQFSHLFQENYVDQLLKRIQHLESALQQVNEESDTIKHESVKMITRVTEAKEMSDKLQKEMKALKKDNYLLRQENATLSAENELKGKELNDLELELQKLRDEIVGYKSHLYSAEEERTSKLSAMTTYDDGGDDDDDDDVGFGISGNHAESVNRCLQFLKMGDDYKKLCKENNHLKNEYQNLKLKLQELEVSKTILEDQIKVLNEQFNDEKQKLVSSETNIQTLIEEKMELENKISLLEYTNTSFREKVNASKQDTLNRLQKLEDQILNFKSSLSADVQLLNNIVVESVMDSFGKTQEIITLKEKFLLQEHIISTLRKELELLQEMHAKNIDRVHNELFAMQKRLDVSCNETLIKEIELEKIRKELTFHQMYKDNLETEHKRFLDNSDSSNDVVSSLINNEVKKVVEELGDEIISLRQVIDRKLTVTEELHWQQKCKNLEQSLQQIIDTGRNVQEKMKMIMQHNEQLIFEKETLLSTVHKQEKYFEQLQVIEDSNKIDSWMSSLHLYQNELTSQLLADREQNFNISELLGSTCTLLETVNEQKEGLLLKLKDNNVIGEKLNQEQTEKKKLEMELQLLKTEIAGREKIQMLLNNEKQKLEADLKDTCNCLQKEKEKYQEQKMLFQAEIRNRDLCIQQWQLKFLESQVLSQVSVSDDALKLVRFSDTLTWHFLEQEKLDLLCGKFRDALADVLLKLKHFLREQFCSEEELKNKCQNEKNLESQMVEMLQYFPSPRLSLPNSFFTLNSEPSSIIVQAVKQLEYILCACHSVMLKKLIDSWRENDKEKMKNISQEIEAIQKQEECAIQFFQMGTSDNFDLSSIQESLQNSLKSKELILEELKHFYDQISATSVERIAKLCSSLSNSCGKIVNELKNIEKWTEDGETVRRLKEELDNLQKEKLELQNTHRLAVDLLSHERDVEISKLRDLIAGIKCGDISALDDVRQELEAKYTKEVEELRRYFEQKVAEVEKHYSEEIVSQHSRKMSDSSCESENDLVSDMYYNGGGDHASHLTTLTHICDPYVAEPDYRELEEDLELDVAKKHITDYQNQLQTIKEELRKKYSNERETLKKNYEAKVETLVRDLSASQQTEIQHLELKYKDELQNLKSRYETEIHNSNARYETVLMNNADKFQEEIDILKQKYAEEITELREKFEVNARKKTEYLFLAVKQYFDTFFMTVKSQFEERKRSKNSAHSATKTIEMNQETADVCSADNDTGKAGNNNELKAEFPVCLKLNSGVLERSAEEEEGYFGDEEKQSIADILNQYETYFTNYRKNLEAEVQSLMDVLEKNERYQCQQLEEKHINEVESLKQQISDLRKQVSSVAGQTVQNVMQQTDVTMADLANILDINCCHPSDTGGEVVADHIAAVELLSHESHIAPEVCTNVPKEIYESLISQLQNEIQQKEDSHSRAICEIKEMHACEIEKLKVAFDRRLHDEVEQVKHEIIKALEEQIQVLLTSDDDTPKPKELVLLQGKLNMCYEKEVLEIKEKHANEISEIKSEYEKVIDELKANNLRNTHELTTTKKVQETSNILKKDCDDAFSHEVCADYQAVVNERDSLRNMAEKLRFLVEELVQYFGVCEEELNIVLAEKLTSWNKVNELKTASPQEQLPFGETSQLKTIVDFQNTNVSVNSLSHTRTSESSYGSNDINVSADNRVDLHDDDENSSLPVAHNVSSEQQVMRKVHFAPNISSIININDESSFMQFIEENKDWSVDIHTELSNCLRRLRKEASALFGLSTTLPEHLNTANSKAKSLEDKVVVLCDELSNEAQEKEGLLVQINELILKNKNLMKDLDLCKIRIGELERERQTKEIVSEGFGENIHSGLTRQLENMAKLQDKARSVISDSTDERNSPYLHLIEELCREGDRLTEEARKEREDLQLQVEAADKLLRSTRQFLEEQAAEREQERDEFIQEIKKLQERLHDREKDKDDYERVVKEGERWAPEQLSIVQSVEALEVQLKETHLLHSEETSRKEEIEGELKAAVDKIWVLREIITELEHQVEQRSQRETELEQRVESLQAILEQQTQNHQRLAEELDSLRIDSGSIELTQHINRLEDELQKHRLHVEQLQSNSTAIQEMKTQLQELGDFIDKKTKDLESLFVPSCSISCSSPSEDVSIREQIESLRCDTPDEVSGSEVPLILPLDDLNRLQEKMHRHSKADEVALKRIHDLEMQLQTVRRNGEEITAERDLLQEKVEQQLVKISSLESQRDEHRRTVKNIQKQASIELQSKIYDMEQNLRSLRETVDEKDSEVKDLKTTLENMREAMSLQETEWMKKFSSEHEEFLSLQVQTEKLLQEKQQLQVSLSQQCTEMSTSMPELLNSVLCEKNAEIDSLMQQLAELQKRVKDYESEKLIQRPQSVKEQKEATETEQSIDNLERKLTLEDVDEMRACEEPTFASQAVSFQAICNETQNTPSLFPESSIQMKPLLKPTSDSSLLIEIPSSNLSMPATGVSDDKVDTVYTDGNGTESDVTILSTDSELLSVDKEHSLKQKVQAKHLKVILTEKLKQTVKKLKQDLEEKSQRLLDCEQKLQDMLSLKEEKEVLENQLVTTIQDITDERNKFQQEKQAMKENEFKLMCEITNLKTLVDEKQSEINYLKGIIISKDEIIKQLEEDNKMTFTSVDQVSQRTTESKELSLLLHQLKEEQESGKALKDELNRLQELNGKIVNEYNSLRKELEKQDTNSLDDLTARVEKELDLSARLDSSLLEKLEPPETVCKCSDPSFTEVVSKILRFGAEVLSPEELSYVQQLIPASDSMNETNHIGMRLSTVNITIPANKFTFHNSCSGSTAMQTTQLLEHKVEQLEAAVESGKKHVLQLLESLNKEKTCNLESEKKVNDLMRVQREQEMEIENLKRQTVYHEERLQQFIVLLEKERVKVRDFENDLHKEKNNVRHLQSLLEAERQRASISNRKDSELIESMRIKLENALDNEMRLRIQIDQAKSNQEALMSQLKCQQLKVESGVNSRDTATLITVKEKCAKLEAIVRQEQRRMVELQTTLSEERMIWQQRLESEKSLIHQLRTDMVFVRTQKEGLEKQLLAAQEKMSTYQLEIDTLRKKLHSLQEIEASFQGRYTAACQEADKARRLLEHAHSQQLELEKKIVTMEQQLSAGNGIGTNGEEIAQLQHENAELHRLLNLSRLHASELSRRLQAMESGTDVPQPILLKLKGVNTILEKHVSDNADLTQRLTCLLEERQQLQGQINDMQVQLQKIKSQLKVSDAEKRNSDAKLVAERAAWTQERATLQLALSQAKAESDMPVGAEAVKDTEQRVNHLFGKYLRAESYRKSLVWQKRYLLVVLGGYEDTESSTIRKLTQLAESSGCKKRSEKHQKTIPRISFRSAAFAVVAIHRMKYLVRRWKYGRLIGGNTVLGRAYSESIIGASSYHGPRRWGSVASSNIWGSTHSQGIQSPPSRDSPVLSQWHQQRVSTLPVGLGEGSSQLLEYIDRFDTIQQHLRLGTPRKS